MQVRMVACKQVRECLEHASNRGSSLKHVEQVRCSSTPRASTSPARSSVCEGAGDLLEVDLGDAVCCHVVRLDHHELGVREYDALALALHY